MASLPKKPQHGDGIETLVPLLGRLIDYCAAITPRSSPSVKAKTVSGGTSFFIRKEATGTTKTAPAAANYGFQVTATIESESGDPPVRRFCVSVLGGPAQILGGEEHVFVDCTNDDKFTNVEEGEYIYVRYKLWDADMLPICAWEDGIQHSLTPPIDETEAPKSSVFLIGRVGSAYKDYVLQFRLGNILAVATVAASATPSGIATTPVP